MQGSKSSSPWDRHHSGKVWPLIGTYTLVANANDFRLMPAGMSRQNFIGGPKIRCAIPRPARWAAMERP